MTTLLHETPAEGPRSVRTLSGDTSPTAVGARAEPPARLRVRVWVDPIVDEMGYDPRSLYVEQYWLPVLGPSTIWMLRRLAAHLDESPDGVDLEVEELARALGLGGRYGQHAPFARTLKRCVDFQMAEWRGATLAVRRHLPPLAARHLKRLPDALQERHATELGASRSPAQSLSSRLRAECRQLALGLIGYGDDRAGVEQQLRRWGFDAPLAAECAEWAAVNATTPRGRPSDLAT